jgi:hypothetical protein
VVGGGFDCVRSSANPKKIDALEGLHVIRSGFWFPSQLPTCMHISPLLFESKGNGDHVCINLDLAHTITCGLKVQNLWTCFQGSLLTQNWGLL